MFENSDVLPHYINNIDFVFDRSENMEQGVVLPKQSNYYGKRCRFFNVYRRYTHLQLDAAENLSVASGHAVCQN